MARKRTAPPDSQTGAQSGAPADPLAEVRIAPDLLLRSVRDEHDISRFSSLLAEHLNIVEGMTADCLMRIHPERRLDEFQIVENTATAEVVSTSCVFPWRLMFAGVELSCVQMEMVFTHPQYRRRGLVHCQIERLHRIIDARGYDLVILWGLPHYYRQFGYSFCVEGQAAQSLPAWRLEGASAGQEAPYRLRPAVSEDIPLLTELFPRTVAGLDVYLQRSARHWRFLLEPVQFPVFMVEPAKGGKPVGYVIQVSHKRTVHIFESSLPDRDTALSLLQLWKADYDEILVNWPANSTLAKLAADLGSVPTRSTQWEFRIPSLPRFLTKITPVLEKRLAASEFHNISTDFVLNLFDEAYRMRFEGGRVAEVQPAGLVDTSMGGEGGTLNIPRDAWIRLVLGDRRVEQLYETWPDIVVKPGNRGLVNTLFPRMNAYLYTAYHYYGPEMCTLDEKYLGYYL